MITREELNKAIDESELLVRMKGLGHPLVEEAFVKVARLAKAWSKAAREAAAEARRRWGEAHVYINEALPERGKADEARAKRLMEEAHAPVGKQQPSRPVIGTGRQRDHVRQFLWDNVAALGIHRGGGEHAIHAFSDYTPGDGDRHYAQTIHRDPFKRKAAERVIEQEMQRIAKDAGKHHEGVSHGWRKSPEGHKLVYEIHFPVMDE